MVSDRLVVRSVWASKEEVPGSNPPSRQGAPEQGTYILKFSSYL